MRDLELLFEKIKPPSGPRITEDTLLYAGLDVHALAGETLSEIEDLTKKDVLWNQTFDHLPENEIVIFNPPPLPKLELEFESVPSLKPKTDLWPLLTLR